jgi:hypothetical protein
MPSFGLHPVGRRGNFAIDGIVILSFCASTAAILGPGLATRTRLRFGSHSFQAAMQRTTVSLT